MELPQSPKSAFSAVLICESAILEWKKEISRVLRVWCLNLIPHPILTICFVPSISASCSELRVWQGKRPYGRELKSWRMEAPKEDVKEESLLSVVEGTSVMGNFTKDGSWQQGLPRLKIILFLVENGWLTRLDLPSSHIHGEAAGPHSTGPRKIKQNSAVSSTRTDLRH